MSDAVDGPATAFRVTVGCSRQGRRLTVLCAGDRVLVGLSTGSLRIYRVNEDAESHNGTANGAAHPGAGPLGAGAGADAHADSDAHADGDAHAHAHADAPPAKPKAADLLREEERFSRRPIQQLGFLKETNILISLSDGYVSIHDLQTYQLQERLEKTRGATTRPARAISLWAKISLVSAEGLWIVVTPKASEA